MFSRLQIMLSCIQLNSVAKRFAFQWPSVVETFLENQDYFSSVGSSLLSLDCILGGDSPISAFYLKEVVFLVVPLVSLLAPLPCFAVWYHYQTRYRGRDPSECRRAAIKWYMSGESRERSRSRLPTRF